MELKRLKYLSEKCDGLLLHGANVEYFTGVAREAGAYLYWDFSSRPRLYAWDVAQAEDTRRTKIKVHPLEELDRELPGKIRLGVNENSLSTPMYKKLKKSRKLVDVSRDVGRIRAVKSKEELKIMKKAAEITGRAFELVAEILEPGVSEKEIAANITSFFLLEGDGQAFEPIVASGRNSVYIHVNPTNKKIRKGETVIVDIGARVKGYASDFTRTFLVDPTRRQLELVEKVLEVWDLVKEVVYPGMKAKELYSLAKEAFGSLAKYWPYGLGHGVGLEVHEFPGINQKSDAVLEEGMVFTLEPGVHLPRVGGVRFEDTGILTKKGFVPLATGF